MAIDDDSIQHSEPVIVTCFQHEMYDKIEVGDTYFFGKLSKNAKGITVQKITRSDKQRFHPSESRIIAGKQIITPKMSLQEAISEQRRNATVRAMVVKVI